MNTEWCEFDQHSANSFGQIKGLHWHILAREATRVKQGPMEHRDKLLVTNICHRDNKILGRSENAREVIYNLFQDVLFA